MGHDLKLPRFVVTGAGGYLGAQVVLELASRNLSAVAVGHRSTPGMLACDLVDAQQVKGLLASIGPAVVIHCAAAAPKTSAGYSDTDAAKASEAMAVNVATYAQGPVVFASSMTVYDSDPLPSGPVHEKQAKYCPRTAYAASKWRTEQCLPDLVPEGVISLRLPGLFGSPRRSGLLYNAACAFLSGKSFQLATLPTLWAALDIRDAACVIVDAACCQLFPSHSILNVGYPGRFGVQAAVARIAALCDMDWTGEKEEYLFEMDLQALHTTLGPVRTSFDERLRNLVDSLRVEIADKGAL